MADQSLEEAQAGLEDVRADIRSALSGDQFDDPEDLARLRSFLERWARKAESLREPGPVDAPGP